MSPQVNKDHQQAEQILGVVNTKFIMQCSGKLWCIVCMAVMVLIGILIMSVYFTAGDDNEVNLGPGNDLSVIKKSSGLHLIEVDNSGSTSVGPGWARLKLVCLGLAILLGLTISHVMYYCYCT